MTDPQTIRYAQAKRTVIFHFILTLTFTLFVFLVAGVSPGLMTCVAAIAFLGAKAWLLRSFLRRQRLPVRPTDPLDAMLARASALRTLNREGKISTDVYVRNLDEMIAATRRIATVARSLKAFPKEENPSSKISASA